MRHNAVQVVGGHNFHRIHLENMYKYCIQRDSSPRAVLIPNWGTVRGSMDSQVQYPSRFFEGREAWWLTLGQLESQSHCIQHCHQHYIVLSHLRPVNARMKHLKHVRRGFISMNYLELSNKSESQVTEAVIQKSISFIKNDVGQQWGVINTCNATKYKRIHNFF